MMLMAVWLGLPWATPLGRFWPIAIVMDSPGSLSLSLAISISRVLVASVGPKVTLVGSDLYQRFVAPPVEGGSERNDHCAIGDCVELHGDLCGSSLFGGMRGRCEADLHLLLGRIDLWGGCGSWGCGRGGLRLSRALGGLGANAATGYDVGVDVCKGSGRH